MNQTPKATIAAANYDPHTIKFFDEEAKQVGELSMKRGELRFTGNADEAAKAFFNSVCDRTFQLTSQIDALKQSNAELLGVLKAIVADDMGNHKAAQEFGGFVLPDELRRQADDAIEKEGGGSAIDEHCTRCRAILPAYGHDAICDSCDKMLEIYKQDEVIAELLGALKRLADEWKYQEGIGNVPSGRAEYDFARAAIAKEEQRIK